jgi:hypothetical protein
VPAVNRRRAAPDRGPTTDTAPSTSRHHHVRDRVCGRPPRRTDVHQDCYL